MSSLSGRCHCGALSWTSNGKILWSAICHCEDCRRAASSDFVSWIGVSRESLTWSGPRHFYRSSARVCRSFCGVCGSPASFETEMFPEETHLYAASLDEPETYRPTAHLFWSERLPWVSVSDSLPKHEKGLQDSAKDGGHLLKQ